MNEKILKSFLKSISSYDLNGLKSIVNANNIMLLDSNGRSFLHFASQNNSITIDSIEYLLLCKSNVNLKDKSQKTCLHYLCYNKAINREMIELLLKYKCDPNLLDNYHKNCLHYAFSRASFPKELILFLINEGGADFDAIDIYQKAPIFYRFGNGLRFRDLQFFLENKASPNLQDDLKRNYFHLLCSSDKITRDSIEFLLDKKVNLKVIDINSKSPLHHLCENKKINLEILKIILERSSDHLNSKDEFERLPIHYLSKLDIPEKIKSSLIKFLIEKKSFLDVQEIVDGNTPLHYLSIRNNFSEELFELFFENKANLNLKNKEGYIPLHSICKENKFSRKILLGLLENKSDPNIITRYSNTPIYFLFKNLTIDTEILKAFVDSNLNPNLYFSPNKLTPLLALSKSSKLNFESVLCLIESKADPNYVEYFGETPLFFMSTNRFVTQETISFLIESKADLSLKYFVNQFIIIFFFFIFIFFGKNKSILGCCWNFEKAVEVLLIFHCEYSDVDFKEVTNEKSVFFFELYKKFGTVFQFSNFKFYPSFIKQRILNFLISQKIFTKENSTLKLPKPILEIVLKYMTIKENFSF